MTAAINFFAGINQISALQGSGLGFFGPAGFGQTVPVGSFQSHTYITDGAGVNQGPEASNVTYLNASSGIIGQSASGVALTCIPNYQATLNISFTNSTPVQATNPQLRIYDRNSINSPASGVVCAVAEIIHPTPTQVNNGSGDTGWLYPQGSGTILMLSPSPGLSGIYAGTGSGSTHTDVQHDWYVVLSASPNTIGSKTNFGAYVYLEYV